MKLKRPLMKVLTKLYPLKEAIEDAIDELFDNENLTEEQQEQVEDAQDELRSIFETLEEDIQCKLEDMIDNL